MNIFLDFDRTIFDTDRFFNEVLCRDPALKTDAARVWLEPPQSPTRIAFFSSVSNLIQEGAVSFAENNLPGYVFPDARAFLMKHGASITIITFGNEFFQKYKIAHALAGVPVFRALYTGFLHKGEILLPECGNQASGVFVDDSPTELASVRRACPGFTVIEMRRDAKAPVGQYLVAHDFGEVESYL